MANTNSRKHGLTKPDSNGYYRPYIGKRDGKDQRFNLGKDLRAAERRYHRIHDLYASCAEGWTEQAISFAKRIAAGEKPLFNPVEAVNPTDLHHSLNRVPKMPGSPNGMYQDALFAQQFEQTKQAYPSLRDTLIADPEKLGNSVDANSAYVALRIEQLKAELDRLSILSASSITVPERLILGTLHEALDAYKADFEAKVPRLPSGNLKQGDRKRGARVKNFKKAHLDRPLHDFDLSQIESIAAHWRNRPTLPNGKRSSQAHAKSHQGELFRFITWLDNTPKFKWEAPKGIKAIPRKIPAFQSEKKFSAVTKETYNPEQLAKIGKTSTDWERLALYLGLNCAMGAAELGRLNIGDFELHTAHRHASQLGIKTTASDSWLRYFRPKTEVFGEWRLWPETVEMVEWAIDRSQKIGSELVFCRKSGKPLYDDDSAKPDAGFANMWSGCQKRSKIDNLLPFGSLRDTLPNYLRQVYDGGSELASLCLTHGTPGIDRLIDCYANKPWGRVHTAVWDSHEYYTPMWKEHKSPSPF